MNLESRLLKIERRVLPLEPTSCQEVTFGEFKRVVLLLFRRHCLRFDGRLRQVVAESSGDEVTYRAAAEVAQLLTAGVVRHPSAVLILLTKDEAGALLAALAAGRISVRHNIGQGDANAAGVHLICDQFDMDVRRLENLCDVGNVALDVYFTQTSDPPPETAADVVSWLRVVQEALGSEGDDETRTKGARCDL